MTREEKLWSMRMADLKTLADKLGIKINTKAAKEKAIQKILEAENVQDWEDNSYEEKQKKAIESDKIAEDTVNKKKAVFSKDITGKTYYHGFQDTPPEKKSAGRNAQLEFEGKSQNICAWAKELGISANTLYGRIYKMGWSVYKAFTTPTRPLKNSKA